MDKQKVSDELTKLVQLNRDSLADIKSDNQDIYNAMLNIMVAIDKKYGGLDLDFIQLDQEITSGGGMPSATEPNDLATIEESKRLINIARWWMSTTEKYTEYENDYPNVNYSGMITEVNGLGFNMPITNYWLKLTKIPTLAEKSLSYEYKNDEWKNKDFNNAVNQGDLSAFLIARGTVWFMTDQKGYVIIKDIHKGEDKTIVVEDFYDNLGNYYGERVFSIKNKDYQTDDDLKKRALLTNKYAELNECVPIALNPLHWEFKKFITAKVNAELKPPTPPAQPKPPKPKVTTISWGRPKLPNILGSNDPNAVRKSLQLNGVTVEYDTSTTWSEDWSNKGWRPSPQRSAGQSKPDAVGYGADGNWYEIRTDKNGRQSWVKMKIGSLNDIDILKKYITKMSDEDIALLVDQKRYYLANIDRDEDEDIYEESDNELAQILGFLEDNGFEKYSNS